ncbi:AbgT family transporter [Wohlfahrtiimonas sp. G9077]|uniref:AbgT family transporter n=1 Tax=Wohlfahrtiimonas sp. G9077 TaxID=1980118 RepID=UPI000B98FD93|nr:AbgT family transporter [Wohlfahrtiimonas sp. G9077]OYQ74431.1 aminobenzoyl-glutamate transporter [Wohlfahrtiimonas sp. G9077]
MAEPKVKDRSVGLVNKFLNGIEWVGNKLPSPSLLFFYSMLLIMVASWPLSYVNFSFSIADASGEINTSVEHVHNLLSGEKIVYFLENFVKIFIGFAPLGVVVVGMLGIGVAERTGYIDVALKKLLNITPNKLLTPMVLFVAMLSHFAADAGYIVVIPIGGILFYAAGRHPVAGIAAAFAGVSAGFSANLIPSTNDILLQGITEQAARIIDPAYTVNVLSNWAFGSASVFFLVIVGWFVTDKIVEPRLAGVKIDGDTQAEERRDVTPKENRAFWIASFVMIAILAVFTIWAMPADSLLRTEGSLTSARAPLMRSIVAIIFIGFIIPGIVYGYLVGYYKKADDVIASLMENMKDMSSFLVMMFFCAFFIEAFTQSGLGRIIALAGAEGLQGLRVGAYTTVVLAILFIAFINLFIGSASAKWVLLSPILVPMMMHLGIAPELTQAAYRVGDSTTNIISPLMTYFALVVVYCQRYVKSTGVGTLISTMIPYTLAFLVTWIVFLLVWWGLGLPLGIEGAYLYTPAS